MDELRVSHLIDEAEDMLDNKFRVGSYCLMVNTDDIQDILDKIKSILPEDIKTAEMILKRRDDIYMEAQSRADRIINEAQNTAANILSESELVRNARAQVAQIQEQLKQTCEELKNKAVEEAEETKRLAYEEARNTREGAQNYAERVLAELDKNVNDIQRSVKQCQELLEQQKNRASDSRQYSKN